MILKENLFQKNCLDPIYYSSEKIYKIIKRQKIQYNSLCKDSIVKLMITHNGNNKPENQDESILESKICIKII